MAHQRKKHSLIDLRSANNTSTINPTPANKFNNFKLHKKENTSRVKDTTENKFPLAQNSLSTPPKLKNRELQQPALADAKFIFDRAIAMLISPIFVRAYSLSSQSRRACDRLWVRGFMPGLTRFTFSSPHTRALPLVKSIGWTSAFSAFGTLGQLFYLCN